MKSSVSQIGAVGLALAGYTLWVLTDTCLKYVGASRLPPLQVIGVLGLVMVGLLLGYGASRRNVRVLWPQRPGRQALRAGLEVGNNVCVVIALRHLPLALFYILIFLSPMVTTLGAAVVLREPLGWKQVVAIATGFAGVVIAVNPLGARAGDWVGYAACMVCVGCFSTNMVWSRVMTQTETKESLIFFSGLTMAVVGGVATLVHADAVSARVLAALGVAALCGLLGSLCFFVALKHTSAANVSQYHYSQLVTGALLVYAMFGERLSAAMVLGAVLIAGAGVYTAGVAYRGREREPEERLLSLRSREAEAGSSRCSE